jgi:transcriptional regulator with XRE-family HTH domain
MRRKRINGAALKRLRESHGLSQQAVSEAAGCCASVIWKLENHPERTTHKRFFALCDLYQVNPLEY